MTRKKRLRAVVAVALVACLAANSSAATRAPRTRARHKVHVTITGSYGIVSAAGDVNGDGANDIAVGSCANDHAGLIYVVFGPFDASEQIDVNQLGERGFVIEGAEPANGSFDGDRACFPGRGGDVNGDGLADILVGAPNASHNNRGSSGCVYVVFGKTSSDTIHLSDFDRNLQTTQGFRIDGAFDRSELGLARNFDSVGDMNDDGLSDLVLGAPFAGTTYVVFGKTDPLPVDLASMHVGMEVDFGYRISTATPSRDSGYSVAGAGDVNGDDITDVVIGVIPKLASKGSAYVVFGKEDGAPRNVSRLGRNGFRIDGSYSGSQTGMSTAGVDDLNGDGLEDVAIGAPAVYGCGRGATYVVFGKKGKKPVDVNHLGGRGFSIHGSNRTCDMFGIPVDSAGDINQDGTSDLVVGAPASSHGGRFAGSVYVIYGDDYKTALKAERLGTRGYRIDVGQEGNSVGAHLAGPGDLNSDGVPDLFFGNNETGDAYVVWSRST